MRCALDVVPTEHAVGSIVASHTRTRILFSGFALLGGLVVLTMSAESGFSVGVKLALVLIVGGSIDLFFSLAALGKAQRI